MEFVRTLAIVVFSVIIHECAHGVVALWRGDTTARDSGRLTLNPLKHIDPIGTIVVPLLLIVGPLVFGFSRIAPIAWAKPVPINPYRMRNPRTDIMFVAAAGPLSNFTVALILAAVLTISGMPYWLVSTLQWALVINLVLAVFNLMPIPPLDGSRLVCGVLPAEAAKQYMKLEQFGVLIILVLLNVGLFDVVWTIVSYIAFFLGVKV